MLYFIIINIFSFIVMYIDKQKAIHCKWRISENFLMSLAIIGGSIGIYLGMNTFNHKTRHLKFKVGVPIIILLQLLLIFFSQ
ncbi:DUF1294 domain-containing protein [Clostridium sp.]|uniref:DUF1294 domain-containing protein n=1 Tax=Clostridium sp. TaxID=1506 RepID=UPI003F3C5F42